MMDDPIRSHAHSYTSDFTRGLLFQLVGVSPARMLNRDKTCNAAKKGNPKTPGLMLNPLITGSIPLFLLIFF